MPPKLPEKPEKKDKPEKAEIPLPLLEFLLAFEKDALLKAAKPDDKEGKMFDAGVKYAIQRVRAHVRKLKL